MTTGLGEAMVIGQATIDERPCELAVMDFSFMGGSMGASSARSSSGPATARRSAARRSSP